MAGFQMKMRVGSQLVSLPLGSGDAPDLQPEVDALAARVAANEAAIAKSTATMTGATAAKAGASGLVPAPAAGSQALFLRADGSWAMPPASSSSTQVVGRPALSLPDTVVAGAQTSFTAQATPFLQGATISAFTLDAPELNLSGQTFAATANAATLTFTVPDATRDTIHISVTAHDNLGNASAPAQATATVIATPIQAARVTAPANGAADVSTRPAIALDPFATLEGFADTAHKVRVQIASDLSFASLLWDSGDIAPSQSVNVSELLPLSTVCHARARWTGATYGPGPWSEVISFTTYSGSVAAPAITAPAASAAVICNDTGVTISTGPFTPEGAADTHAATDWAIAAGDQIIISALDSADLLSHMFTAAELAGKITDGQTLQARARHRGSALGESPWASVTFTARLASVAAPTLTAAGSEIIFNDAGITLNTGAFAVNHATDTHETSDWKLCSDLNGVSVVLQALDSADKLSHTFTAAQCAGLSDGATLYAFARHRGGRFGAGPWSAAVAIKMKKGQVNTPAIATPKENEEVYIGAGTLAVTASAFGVSAGSDTHRQSDWQLCADAACASVIRQDLNSADLTAHTFTGISATGAAYIRARYQGNKFGLSPWSAARKISLSSVITTPGGRKAWRHSSGKGTVLVINDNGMIVNLLVLDAQYRGKAKWDSVYSYNGPTIAAENPLDTSLTNYTNIPTSLTIAISYCVISYISICNY